jgi:ribosomal protein S4
MRFQKKYKSLSLQNKNNLIDLPTRILKFKRTKWLSLITTIKKKKRLKFFLYVTSFIKKKIKKKTIKFLKKSYLLGKRSLDQTTELTYTKRISFYNSKLQIPVKKWEKVQKKYKTSLKLKNYYSQLYDNKLMYKWMKKNIFLYKNIKELNSFYQSMMQFEFRLDILLWRLRLFKTSYQSSLFINHKFIKVNSKNVKSNYILKAGDIISFENKINLIQNLKRLKKTFLLMNFIEVDYYSNSIIILFSVNEMNKLDYFLFMKQYFNLMKFSYSFIK